MGRTESKPMRNASDNQPVRGAMVKEREGKEAKFPHHDSSYIKWGACQGPGCHVTASCARNCCADVI